MSRKTGNVSSAHSRAVPPRPRVLVVSISYSEPGLRRQIQELANRIDVRLVAPRRAHVLVFPDLEVADDGSGLMVTYPRVGLFGSQFLLRSLSLGLRRYRPDVVHVDFEPWSVIFWQVRLAAFLFARDAVVICGAKKNTYRRYPGLRGRAKLLVAKAGLASTDHVMAASRMTARMFSKELGVSDDRLSVTTHVGIDTAKFAPEHAVANSPAAGAGDGIRVGYCGRLSAQKGVLDLLEAIEVCRGEFPQLQLELLGAGELEEMLNQLAASRPWLRVSGSVASDDLVPFFRSLDLYVLPARVLPDHEEHDAHAMLQALACGVPVVATRSGIIPEILGDGTGVIVEPAPASLRDGIARMLSDPACRDRFAARSRTKAVESFAFDAVASTKVDVYRRVLARR